MAPSFQIGLTNSRCISVCGGGQKQMKTTIHPAANGLLATTDEKTQQKDSNLSKGNDRFNSNSFHSRLNSPKKSHHEAFNFGLQGHIIGLRGIFHAQCTCTERKCSERSKLHIAAQYCSGKCLTAGERYGGTRDFVRDRHRRADSDGGVAAVGEVAGESVG